MVALPPVQNTVRVALAHTLSGQNVINVFYVKCTTVGFALTQGDVQAVADGVANAHKTNFLPQLNNGLQLTGAHAVDLSGPVSPIADSTVSGPGGSASPLSTTSAACVVSWRISRRYRGGHPRTYLGGITQGSFTTGRSFTGAFVTAVSTAAANFRTAVNAITTANLSAAQLSCVHYYQNRVLLAVPLVDSITSAAVNSRLDSQRRRLGKV
jgi:hypothetical protein